MFEPTDVVTLDDGKKYVIADEMEYKGKNYICMCELEDPKNITFCEYEKNGENIDFIDVEDPDLMIALMKIINDKVNPPKEG